MGQETWTEIMLSVPQADLEYASDIANDCVPYGIYIEDYAELEAECLEIAHIDLIDETLKAKDRSHSVIHLYLPGDAQVQEALAFLRGRLEAAGIAYGLDTSVCEQEDWINNWKQYYKPTPAGSKLLIQPLWYDRVEADGRKILKLEPGLAFGTGTHTTTQLCIRLLEQAGVEGAQVLDIGCGSGILSIAALLLGAAGATGIDIDPVAVKTARENGNANGMKPPAYQVIEGDLLDKVSGRYPVIAANIVADTILSLLPVVPRFLEPGGRFLISGIIDARCGEIETEITRQGLQTVQKLEDNGWAAYLLRYPA